MKSHQLPKIIESSRLMLVSMSLDFLRFSLDEDKAKAEAELGFATHDDWFREKDLIELRLRQIEAEPEVQSWLLRAVISKRSQSMIGHFNGHTAPGPEYLKPLTSGRAVEIGFTIYPEFRRQGYLDESVEAFSKIVKSSHAAEELVLSIQPHDPVMGQFVQSRGYTFIGKLQDESGEELVYKKIL